VGESCGGSSAWSRAALTHCLLRRWPISPLIRCGYISPDRPLHGASDDSFTPVLDYHNETVNAPAAWTQGLNGAGIGVAVIDSGINDLPDLDNNAGSLVAYSQDFTGDPSGSAPTSTATALMSPASSLEPAPGPQVATTPILSSVLPTREPYQTSACSTRMAKVPIAGSSLPLTLPSS